MLSNEKFVSKAPEAKVQEEREKLETYRPVSYTHLDVYKRQTQACAMDLI